MVRIYISNRYPSSEKELQLNPGKQISPYPLSHSRVKIEKDVTEIIINISINGESVSDFVSPFYFAPNSFYHESSNGLFIKLHYKNKTESFDVIDKFNSFWNSGDKKDL